MAPNWLIQPLIETSGGGGWWRVATKFSVKHQGKDIHHPPSTIYKWPLSDLPGSTPCPSLSLSFTIADEYSDSVSTDSTTGCLSYCSMRHHLPAWHVPQSPFRVNRVKHSSNFFCEAQARVRQGWSRVGQLKAPNGPYWPKRPFNPCLELTLKLVVTHPPTTHPPVSLILLN